VDALVVEMEQQAIKLDSRITSGNEPAGNRTQGGSGDQPSWRSTCCSSSDLPHGDDDVPTDRRARQITLPKANADPVKQRPRESTSASTRKAAKIEREPAFTFTSVDGRGVRSVWPAIRRIPSSSSTPTRGDAPVGRARDGSSAPRHRAHHVRDAGIAERAAK
jgi:hypothetical protein